MGYSNIELLDLRNRTCVLSTNVLNILNHHNLIKMPSVRTVRGVRGGKHEKKKILVRTSNRTWKGEERGICYNNLQYVKCEPSNERHVSPVQKLTVCTANMQSAIHKTQKIVDYVLEKDIDVFIITELWLQDEDTIEVGELEPEGYKIKSNPRNGRRG